MATINLRIPEDEYDLKVFEEYEKEKANGTLKTRPINKLWEECALTTHGRKSSHDLHKRK